MNTRLFLSLASLLLATSVVAQTNWEWRNPKPQGGALYPIVYGGSQFVAAGPLGTLVTSADGTNWASQSTGSRQVIYGLAYGNGTYVGSGIFGAMFTSPNATHWVQHDISGVFSGWINGVTFGNNLFVAVGDSGKILTSPNGITWTARNSGSSATGKAVAWGNGLFVAVGTGGSVLTSPDGITWTAQTTGTSGSLNHVTYGNNRFLAVGYGTILVSTNGANWTAGAAPDYVNLSGVAAANDRYAVIGYGGRLLTSSNGLEWVECASPTTANLNGVVFGGGKFVAIGDAGMTLASADGITWGAISQGRTTTFREVVRAGNKFVAVGAQGIAYVSPDGLEWSHQSVGANEELYDVAYQDNRLVAVGSGGSVFISSDATNWTMFPQGSPGLQALTWGNQLWVAVGGSGRILTSPDGTNWFPQTSGISDSLSDVAYGNGGFVAVGGGGVKLFSPDATNWTAAPVLYGNAMSGVVFGAGLWVAVGGNGVVTTSPDGTHWTDRGASGLSLNAVEFLRNQFMAVGNSGYVATSMDGINWSTSYVGGGPLLYGVTYGAGQYLAAGAAGAIVAQRTLDPGITSPTTVEAIAGQAFNYQITADGSPIGFGAPDLPAGLTVDPNTGVISGSLSGPGVYEVTLLASNIYGTGSALLTINSHWPFQPPVITSAHQMSGAFGQGFRYQCVAANAPTHFEAEGLPAGLVLNPDTGEISGAAYVSGVFKVTLRASNAHGQSTTNVTLTFAPRSPGQRWFYHGPLPGNTGVGAMAHGGGLYVAPGLISCDGINWCEPPNPSPAFNCIIYARNQFVAGGASGIIYTSTNGLHWTTNTTPITSPLYALAHGDGLLVAVGPGGTVISSPDGLNWTPRTSNTGNHLMAVTYGNGQFVAVGGYGTVVTSSDGIHWVVRTPGISSDLECITFGRDLFVAGGGFIGVNGRLYVSANGVDWTAQVTNIGEVIYSVVYANNAFVASGWAGRLLTSVDGFTWIQRNVPTSDTLRVAAGPGQFVLRGDWGTLLTSPDAINWQSNGGTPLNQRAASYIQGRFLVGDDGGQLKTSSNGVQWTPPIRLPGLASMINNIAAAGAEIWAVGAYGGLAVSLDGGTVWASRSTGFYNNLNDLVQANGVYVIGAGQYEGPPLGTVGEIITSPDGSNWASPTGSTTNAFNGVVYAQNLFVAVASRGAVWTSPDGQTWTAQPSPTTGWLLRVAYGQGRFVAVGADGVIMTSPNGTNWTLQTSGTGEYLRDIAFGNHRFVVVGDRGTILVSNDGLGWTAEPAPVANNLYAVAYGQGTFLASGDYGTLLLSPMLEPFITSPPEVYAIAGQPLNYAITAWNGPISGYGAAGLPAWATLNTTSGQIYGTAVLGTNLLAVFATNEFGVGSNTVALRVLAVWNYEAWAASHGLAGSNASVDADLEPDGLPNLGEYGLVGHPLELDAAGIRPRVRLLTLFGQKYLAMTYRRPAGGTSDLLHRVTASAGVVPWQNATSVVIVGSPVNFGAYEEITVRSTSSIKASAQGYLQLEIVKP